MHNKKTPINEEALLWIFAWSIIGVMFVLPKVTSLKINTWIQYLAYSGGLLLAIEFLGKSRIATADSLVSTNAGYISQKFTDFFLYYFLIKVDDPKERWELASWYIFCVLDTIFIIVLISYTLPELDINIRPFLKEHIAKHKIWVFSFVLVLSPLLGLWISRFIDAIIKKLIAKEIRSGKIILNIISVPVFIIGGPITLPWLIFVALAWLFLEAILLIVHLKNRLQLGNVFLVFGFLMLFTSFALFIIEQIRKSSS